MEQNFYESMQSITIDEIELCYLSLNSKTSLPFESKTKSPSQTLSERNIDNPFNSGDLDFLLNNLLQTVQTEEAENELDIFITKTALIATVITDLKTMNMIQSTFDEFCLVTELKMCMSKIMNEISGINWSKYLKHAQYVLEITKALVLLYRTTFDTSVNYIIVNSTSLDAVKKLLEIRKYKSSESEKLQESQINIMIALASFSCIHTGNEMADFQVQIASTLLKLKKYNFSNESDVIGVLTMLQIYSNISQRVIIDELLDLLMVFVQEVFVEWQRDDRVNRRLLHLLPKFLDKIAMAEDKAHVHNVFLICKHYHDKFAKGEFGQLTHVSLVKCLNSIINHKTFLSSSENGVLDDDIFITFVKSSYYLVRLESLQCIYSIFSSKKIDHTWKETFFYKLKDFVSNIFIIQRDLSADEIQEERFMRSISAIQILATVICSQSIFQSSALLTLIQIIDDKDIDMGIVLKTVKAINNSGLSFKKIMECNLNYLLTNWCRDRSFIKFPRVLLDPTGQSSFNEDYAHIIFPVFIREGKFDEAERMCTSLHAPFQDLFRSCCPSIIPWALSGEAPDVLEQIQNKAGRFKQVGNLSTLVRENLYQTIVETVQRLRDINHFFTTFKTTINLPEGDPPHYKCDVVDQCFDRLSQIVFGESRDTLFHHIITSQPSVVQKVLMQLTRNIYANGATGYKAIAIHQYVYFLSKIAGDLRETYCDNSAPYFIKDITTTLLHLTTEDDKFIAELVCKYLHVFLKDQLPQRKAQVGKILNFCVKTLSHLVSEQGVLCSLAKDILRLLLIDEKEALAEAIKKLSSFPNCEPWNGREYGNDQDPDTQVLQDDIKNFLIISGEHGSSADSLLKLKRQLIAKKNELETLYEALESSQGFSEDCVASYLHRLIYQLIQLTKSQDTKVALEAAKCLGVLGPSNLFTTILHPEEAQVKEANKVEILTHKLCELLIDMISSPDIETRTLSSNALYVLSQYECREISASLQDLLYPFQSSHKHKYSNKKLKVEADDTAFHQAFDPHNWWCEKSEMPYNTWVTELTCAVAMCLTGFYSESLIPLFKLNVRCCELVLPRLIGIIIEVYPGTATTVCHCINYFFKHHFHCGHFDMEKVRNSPARDAIGCVLNIVNYMRIQADEQIPLDLDYLLIALAAQLCSAYFSSILYAELWCRSTLKNPRDFDSVPIIEQIYEIPNSPRPDPGKSAQDVLREAYMKIGDTDSIHGCGSLHLKMQNSKISYYTHFQKLDKLALSHDVQCSVSNDSERGLITALKGLGLEHVAKRLLSTVPSQADPMEDLSYDCFWRLSDWNQITDFQRSWSKNDTGTFSASHYEALKCLHENNKSSLSDSLDQAHLCVIKELGNISLESCKAVYPKLTQLRMLHEIEECNSSDPYKYDALFEKWEECKYICNNDLQYIEPILTQRTVICKMRNFQDRYEDAFANIQFKIAEQAQQEGNFNIASRALELLSKSATLDMQELCRLRYHEAILALKRNDQDMARYNLRSIISIDYIEPSLLAQSLHLYGNMVAENKSENPQAIISKYFEKSIATYLNVAHLTPEILREQSKALASLAEFAHEQYLIICDYMNSSQFESLQECISYSRKVNHNKPSNKGDKDVERAFIITDRQSHIDSIEVENIKKDKAMYLSLALNNYLETLRKSDEHDFLIFRLVSLWLSTENMYNEDVNRILDGQLELIPSYKFIPLVPQLAPHMSNVDDTFTGKISSVLERCAKEHPHHILPVLLALKNLYNDDKYCNKKNTTIEARVLGAQLLVQQLLSSSIRPIVQEMDKTSEALVMLAYYDADKKKAVVPKCSIPRNLLINEIKNFKHSSVPTIILDIKKNGNYTNIVSIRKYESSYENVGGINAPKKIICVGTDGKLRPQLVKGRDDLRQDAVMQQVFTVMNSLLKSSKDAKQRNLHVRTYKVVPLTQRSGILEWCINTLPLSVILTGDGKRLNGLHQKYYPESYTPTECRKKIAAAKGNQQFPVFMDCCKNLPPAFHYFFTENYLSPEIWFERRTAYTRSVATTSIIGYILGLGDRHVSNILVDKSTAEVIHIDFGIAFEQGKVLPTPETVPFRLTRDMEAGMGVTGVEGTMRRCCEETVTVLREQKEIIVTLLRVLLYDPLYSWAITPAKAATYQSENSTRSSENKDSSPGIAETNKLAERALLRVQQKLQGIEEGVSSSVPGQVTRLIQQARDPANLCRLFAGWQAYL